MMIHIKAEGALFRETAWKSIWADIELTGSVNYKGV